MVAQWLLHNLNQNWLFFFHLDKIFHFWTRFKGTFQNNLEQCNICCYGQIKEKWKSIISFVVFGAKIKMETQRSLVSFRTKCCSLRRSRNSVCSSVSDLLGAPGSHPLGSQPQHLREQLAVFVPAEGHPVWGRSRESRGEDGLVEGLLKRDGFWGG